MLLLHANEVVSRDRLIDELWGAAPPPTAQTGLHGYVSTLRKLLGADRVETRGTGYLLRVWEDELDRERFEALVRAGRHGDALEVWRGPPLADFADEPWAQAEIGRLEELRLACVEARIDADLEAGRAAELVGELEALVADHPFRERLRGQLMLALYRSGRQVEALEAYRAGRSTLVGELGIEPGRELKELERRMLVQDPSLLLRPRFSARRPGRRPVLAAAALALAAAAAALALLLSSDEGVPVIPNSVVRIDPETNDVVSVIKVGDGPVGIAKVGDHLWVANRADDTLTRINTDSQKVRTYGTVPFPSSLTAEGPRIWIGSEGVNEVVAIDGTTGGVLERVRVAFEPAGFVDFGEGSLWVSHGGIQPGLRPEAPTGVSRVDVLARRAEHDRLPTGQAVAWLAVGEGAAWISLTGRGELLRVDARDGSRRRISVGGTPLGVAVGFGAVWVASKADNSVWRVHPHTGNVDDVIDVGEQPFPVAVGAGSVWVGNHREGTVSRIDPDRGVVEETIQLEYFPTAIHADDDAVWVAVSSERLFDGAQVLG